MSLRDKIPEDLKTALRNREEVDLRVLRMLQSALKNKEIDVGKRELTDEDVIGVITTEIKKRREAAKEFEKVGRPDAAADETEEAEVLLRYMPEQMGEDEIRALVSEVIAQTGAEGMKDMGKVMKELMPKVKGKADGSVVNQLVKEELEKAGEQ